MDEWIERKLEEFDEEFPDGSFVTHHFHKYEVDGEDSVDFRTRKMLKDFLRKTLQSVEIDEDRLINTLALSQFIHGVSFGYLPDFGNNRQRINWVEERLKIISEAIAREKPFKIKQL